MNMKYNQLLFVAVIVTTAVSCKKDTLIEVVDVPAAPIVAVEQKGGKPTDVKAIQGAFELMELPFGYKDLEPHLDALTTELHYSKHHLGYVNSLNKAVIGTKYEVLEIEPILKSLNLSDEIIRSNAGGVYNHNFFWEELAPKAGGEPEGELLEAIIKDFGSFDEFRRLFTETSVKLTGSGWAWLVSDKTGKLKIVITNNNDNPLMKNLGVSGIPILNVDLWEHAYYLKFQNRKRDYVNTFFSVVNWDVAQKRYEAFGKVARVTAPVVSETLPTTEEVPVEQVPTETP